MLAENFPTKYQEAFQKVTKGVREGLDVKELFNLWRDISKVSEEDDPPLLGSTYQKDMYAKLLSSVAMVRKQRNLFAHGEAYTPASLVRSLQAADRIIKACNSSKPGSYAQEF